MLAVCRADCRRRGCLWLARGVRCSAATAAWLRFAGASCGVGPVGSPLVSVAVAASWGLLGGSLGITDGRALNPPVGDTVLLPPLFTGPYCSASCSLTVSSFALAACWGRTRALLSARSTSQFGHHWTYIGITLRRHIHVRDCRIETGGRAQNPAGRQMGPMLTLPTFADSDGEMSLRTSGIKKAGPLTRPSECSWQHVKLPAGALARHDVFQLLKQSFDVFEGFRDVVGHLVLVEVFLERAGGVEQAVDVPVADLGTQAAGDLMQVSVWVAWSTCCG